MTQSDRRSGFMFQYLGRPSGGAAAGRIHRGRRCCCDSLLAGIEAHCVWR